MPFLGGNNAVGHGGLRAIESCRLMGILAVAKCFFAVEREIYRVRQLADVRNCLGKVSRDRRVVCARMRISFACQLGVAARGLFPPALAVVRPLACIALDRSRPRHRHGSWLRLESNSGHRCRCFRWPVHRSRRALPPLRQTGRDSQQPDRSTRSRDDPSLHDVPAHHAVRGCRHESLGAMS